MIKDPCQQNQLVIYDNVFIMESTDFLVSRVSCLLNNNNNSNLFIQVNVTSKGQGQNRNYF